MIRCGDSLDLSPQHCEAGQCHISAMQQGDLAMAEPTNPMVAFSDHSAQLVERIASSVVAVHTRL
jgi:hypothetical protein